MFKCFKLRRRSGKVRLLVFLMCLFFGSMFLLSGPQRDLCGLSEPGSKPPPKHQIPKSIHRIWNSGPIPDRFRNNWDHCKQVNPDYTHMLWNDTAIEKLIETYYPWFMPTYRSYPYHMERLDAGRYFIIYHYGGLYLDMDVDCRVSFKNIFKNITKDFEVMIGGGLPVGLATSFFGASPKHPFISTLVHHLNESLGWYLTPYWSVMASTGPIYIYKKYLEYPCKEQINVMAPHLHKQVYMVHEHAGTWHRWDGPIFVWIDRHLKYVIVLGAILVTILVLALYCHRTKRRMRVEPLSHSSSSSRGGVAAAVYPPLAGYKPLGVPHHDKGLPTKDGMNH